MSAPDPSRPAVIIGRPNVGKSALFNRLAGRRISIVHDQPGVTRDRIEAVCTRGQEPFVIVDTGGIGDAPDPDFALATHQAADEALDSAGVIVFVVDGQSGLVPLDRELAGKLRRAGRPVLLVVNKIDQGLHEPLAAEFTGLGFPAVFSVSAAHGRGIDELVEAILQALGKVEGAGTEPPREDPLPKIALVGRPNVGKSSLLNALLGRARAIVSEIAGTTRDVVEIPLRLGGDDYLLCDTAGIRHRSRHKTSVEVFSVMRSEAAIAAADVCVLLLDASVGVTEQDKRIAGLVHKARKAVVVVLNKADLVTGRTGTRDGLKQLLGEVRQELFFLDYAPLVLLSAKTGGDVRRLATQLEKVRQHAARPLGTGVLNRLLQHALQEHPPPARAGARLKIFYATRLEDAGGRPFAPVRLLLFVNNPKLMLPSYEAYLQRCIRAEREYPGLPVILQLRERTGELRRGKRAGS